MHEADAVARAANFLFRWHAAERHSFLSSTTFLICRILDDAAAPGVARAVSRRPASLSAGVPAAPAMRPRCDGPSTDPQAAATQSPEAASRPTRGHLRPQPLLATRTLLPAAPSAMAERVSGSLGEEARPGAESNRWALVRSCTGRRPRQTLFHRPVEAEAAVTFWRGDIARAETSAGLGPGGRQSAGNGGGGGEKM